jgi:general secretion pathway protein G
MIRAHSHIPAHRWPAVMSKTALRPHPGIRSRGFTLIEIMVVVVIIGLLAAVIVPRVVSKVDDARVAKARQDIRAIQTALIEFRLDNFRYPTTDQGLKVLVQQPSDPTIKNWRQGGYLEQGSLKDPWGNEYQYVYPGTHGQEYDLYSFGRDGQEGGEGLDADIGNWNIDQNGPNNNNNNSGATGGR